MSDEFIYTLIEVGTELDVSLATSKKYFKQFKPYIPHDMQGRTPLFSKEGVRRMKILGRFYQDKKSIEKIEAAMAKKFPEEVSAYEDYKQESNKTKPPLIKRVENLEKRLENIARFSQLDKRISALEGKSNQNVDKEVKQKLNQLEKDLERIRKLLEG